MRVAALLLLVVAQVAEAKVPHSPASIDHVTLETNDLEKAMREFERRTGVKPQYGGSYGGRGLRNAIVSLGSGRFLEILGPQPEGDADDEHINPRPRPYKPPAPLYITPGSWTIATQDLMAMRRRLQRGGFDVPPLLGSDNFRWSDDRKSSWDWFRVYDIDHEVSPFLIQWDRGSRRPSSSAPKGCRLHRLAIATPQTAILRRLITQLGLQQVQVRRAAKSRLSFSFDCPKGRVNF